MRTEHDRLSERERDELASFDDGTYSCDCETERCPSNPCQNGRDDLYTTVERIVADRVAQARAEGAAEALREHRDAFVSVSKSAPEYDADVWLAAADTLDDSVSRIESGHDSEDDT